MKTPRWLRRALCAVLGHGDDVLHVDGRGAAWSRCCRCEALTGTHTWHGGEPWHDDGTELRVTEADLVRWGTA